MFSNLNKRSTKLILGFVGILILALGAWYASFYFSPEMREHRAAKEYIENQKEKYRNDTYGSTTPEGTLELFVQALEEGDMELASKYFVIDRQSAKEKELRRLKKEYGLERVSKDAQNLELSKKTENEAFYVITNEEDQVQVQVVLRKNSKGQWKISEL